MTRRDIRRGTIGTLLFSILAYAFIIILSFRHSSCSRSDALADDGLPGVTWTDTLSNSSSDWSPLNPMDRDIERFMQKWDIRGMSIAVTRNDSLLYTKGYGFADAEARIEMKPTGIMRIASASKLVTAIAAMKLIEEGKMSLDSRIFGPDGLIPDPEYTEAMCDSRMLDITVDHLLRHMGGFGLGAGDPMFTTNEIIKAKHLDHPLTREELIRIVLGRRIAFSPGEGRRYSNFGYMLLSTAMERVSGKSYWDYVTDEILRPAGCDNFRPATNYYEERLEREVKYYGPDNEDVEEFNGSGRMVPRVYGGNDIHALLGAGGWLASAPELARLVASADADPRLKDVISPSSVAALTGWSEDENIARGWSETDEHGRWTRTGTLSSSHALIRRFPDGECWVLLTNTGVWTGHHFSGDMLRLVDMLRSRYSGSMPRRNLF